MKHKMTLLALAAFSAALFALPSVASAGEWTMDCPGGKATCSFTTSGGHAELRAVNEPTITCTSSTGSGSVSTGGTTGTFGITFKGCTATLFFTASCNSAGAASGEIKVATSTSHNVYLEPEKTTPGILVTPSTTEITCAGFSNITVTGNGLLGDLTASCNQESETILLLLLETRTHSSGSRSQQRERSTTCTPGQGQAANRVQRLWSHPVRSNTPEKQKLHAPELTRLAP
jgi:hypothetical protein